MRETGNCMDKILIIAYGNPLRTDDGLAWEAAEELSRRLPEDVDVIRVHQLTPELAEDASRAHLLIFLDASMNSTQGDVFARQVSPQLGELCLSHHVTPETILSACNRLYSAQPDAFLVSMRGECFDYGESPSNGAIATVRKTVEVVKKLLESHVQRFTAHRPDRSECFRS